MYNSLPLKVHRWLQYSSISGRMFTVTFKSTLFLPTINVIGPFTCLKNSKLRTEPRQQGRRITCCFFKDEDCVTSLVFWLIQALHYCSETKKKGLIFLHGKGPFIVLAWKNLKFRCEVIKVWISVFGKGSVFMPLFQKRKRKFRHFHWKRKEKKKEMIYWFFHLGPSQKADNKAESWRHCVSCDGCAAQ